MLDMDHLSPRARNAPESGIVAVVNHGRLKEGLIPLWAGEGDLPTAGFIAEAASAALKAGETFYTWQRGIPELREALSRYNSGLYGTAVPKEAVFVTGSGMQAIKLAVEAVTEPGDEIVYLTPAWPNFAAAMGISGAVPVAVRLDSVAGGWSLDMNRLEAAITPRTRGLFINTPANPTGWTASEDELRQILDIARRHDLWIVADEIYTRFYYSGPRAPSFFDVKADDDRILFVNSFSKNWSMTGWRVGWIVAPPEIGQVLENLIQYSTSGVAPFMQRGAVAALEVGEAVVAENIARATAARDILCDALAATNRVALEKPEGAFYAFFSIDGAGDTMRTAKDIVDRAGVGLAPGSAFGPGGEGFFRACFLRRLDQIEEAAARLTRYIGAL
ncbi:MAG: pyridoxal phosphate-dependent aminotransferase [Pararhizobium sp.]